MLRFDDLINKVENAIQFYPFTNSQDNEATKMDKLGLLKMVKYALETFSTDRNLNAIFPARGMTESNLEFTKRAVVKKLTDLVRKSREYQEDETVSEESLEEVDPDAVMIVDYYIKGFGAIPNMNSFQKKHAFFMTEMLKLMKEMRPDANDVEATAPGFTQLESIQVWEKLCMKLKQKKGRSSVSNGYIECCICFCRMAFGSLSALVSTFHLERTGFIVY